MPSSPLLRFVSNRIRRGGEADRGDIIIGWLVRVVLLLGVLGVLVFEGLSLVTARVNGMDIANKVAYEASEAYLNSNAGQKARVKAARIAAETEAAEHTAEVVKNSMKVAEDGTVTLRIRRTAGTILLYRSRYTADYAVVISDGHARSAAQ
jgi:hypothetical protein